MAAHPPRTGRRPREGPLLHLIATADACSGGESEEIVGRALKGRRAGVVLATKFLLPMGEDPNQRGSSRRWIVRAVEGSLRRLGTDHIDLHQVHRPDPSVDVEETLSALSDLVRAGKVRAIGSSTFPASNMVEAQRVAERRGLERFRSERPTCSLLNRGIEREVLPVAQRYGMGTIVWSPLAQGMLTGRVRRGQHSDLHRAGTFTHLSDERRIDEIVAPGTDVGRLDMAYDPPAVTQPRLRRRAADERAAG